MVKSAKGKEVDMEALREANGNAVALGNANMNARGDLLGKGGRVVKLREDLAREYHNAVGKNAVKNVAISKTTKEAEEDQQNKAEQEKEVQKKAKSNQRSSTGQTKPKQTEISKKKENSEDGENSDSEWQKLLPNLLDFDIL